MKNIYKNCTGFQWDPGNIDKSWFKHKITPLESEQIFFNQPLLILEDDEHSSQEKRLFALGKTDGGSPLFVVFTARKNLIRIISARKMSSKERKIYEKENS